MWTPGAAEIYLGQPEFVQTPGKTEEDDGVILVGGFNSTSKKGAECDTKPVFTRPRIGYRQRTKYGTEPRTQRVYGKRDKGE